VRFGHYDSTGKIRLVLTVIALFFIARQCITAMQSAILAFHLSIRPSVTHLTVNQSSDQAEVASFSTPRTASGEIPFQ